MAYEDVLYYNYWVAEDVLFDYDRLSCYNLECYVTGLWGMLPQENWILNHILPNLIILLHSQIIRLTHKCQCTVYMSLGFGYYPFINCELERRGLAHLWGGSRNFTNGGVVSICAQGARENFKTTPNFYFDLANFTAHP